MQCSPLSVDVFRDGCVRLNYALGSPSFTKEHLSEDLRLVIVVCNTAFGVDLGTAVPDGQVTRLSVEVNGIIVDRLLGHIYRTRY